MSYTKESMYDNDNPELLSLVETRAEAARGSFRAAMESERADWLLKPRIQELRAEAHAKHGTNFHVYVVLVEGFPRFVDVCSGATLPTVQEIIRKNSRIRRIVAKKGEGCIAMSYVEGWLTEEAAIANKKELVYNLINDGWVLYQSKPQGEYEYPSFLTYMMACSISSLKFTWRDAQERGEAINWKPSWWNPMICRFQPNKWDESDREPTGGCECCVN